MLYSTPLEATTLRRRYKRFLADVSHPTLGEITVHCPNTGSMKNCWEEGWRAWILESDNVKRKYRYTWVLSESPTGELIGINTHFANQVVYDAIIENKVKPFIGSRDIKREVKYGQENSRIDIFCREQTGRDVYIEVKSVTLKESDGRGYFPDAVTTRGQKHLRELMGCANLGHRAVLFFLVQHSGIHSVSPASHIDPAYSALFVEAVEAGVEVMAYSTKMSATGIELDKSIPIN